MMDEAIRRNQISKRLIQKKESKDTSPNSSPVCSQHERPWYPGSSSRQSCRSRYPLHCLQKRLKPAWRHRRLPEGELSFFITESMVQSLFSGAVSHNDFLSPSTFLYMTKAGQWLPAHTLPARPARISNNSSGQWEKPVPAGALPPVLPVLPIVGQFLC